MIHKNMEKAVKRAFYAWYLVLFISAFTGAEYIFISTEVIGGIYAVSRVWAAITVFVVFVAGLRFIKFPFLFLWGMYFDVVLGARFITDLQRTSFFWDSILNKIVSPEILAKGVFGDSFSVFGELDSFYTHLSVLSSVLISTLALKAFDISCKANEEHNASKLN
jgi:hypothetical protein